MQPELETSTNDTNVIEVVYPIKFNETIFSPINIWCTKKKQAINERTAVGNNRKYYFS